MVIALHADRRAIREAREKRKSDRELAIARMIVSPITNAIAQFGAQAAVKYLPPSEGERKKASEEVGQTLDEAYTPDLEAIERQRARTEVQPTPAAAKLRPPPAPGQTERAIRTEGGLDVLVGPVPADPPVRSFDLRTGQSDLLAKHVDNMTARQASEQKMHASRALIRPDEPTKAPTKAPVMPRRRHEVPEAVWGKPGQKAGLSAAIPSDRLSRRLPEGVAMERQGPTSFARKLKSMSSDDAAKLLSGDESRGDSPFYKVKEGWEDHVKRATAVRKGIEHKRGLEQSRFMLDQQKLLRQLAADELDLREYMGRAAKLRSDSRKETDPSALMPGGSGFSRNSPNGRWVVTYHEAKRMGREKDIIPMSPLEEEELKKGRHVLVSIPYNAKERQEILARNARVKNRKDRAASKREAKYRPLTVTIRGVRVPDTGVPAFLADDASSTLSPGDRAILSGFSDPYDSQTKRASDIRRLSSEGGTLLTDYLKGIHIAKKKEDKAITTEAGLKSHAIKTLRDRKQRIFDGFGNDREKGIAKMRDKTWRGASKRTIDSFIGMGTFGDLPGPTKRAIRIFARKDSKWVPKGADREMEIPVEAWYDLTKLPGLKKAYERKIKRWNKDIENHEGLNPIGEGDVFETKPGGSRSTGTPQVPPPSSAKSARARGRERAMAAAPRRTQRAREQFVAGFNKINALDEPASAKRRRLIALANRLGINNQVMG